jgi:hypothetical protein
MRPETDIIVAMHDERPRLLLCLLLRRTRREWHDLLLQGEPPAAATDPATFFSEGGSARGKLVRGAVRRREAIGMKREGLSEGAR